MASTPVSATGSISARAVSPFADDADPRFVFRTLLARQPLHALRAVAKARGHESEAARAATLAGELTDLLDDPLGLREVRQGLSDADRTAMGLFGLTEARSWPLAGLRLALAALAVDADATLVGLVHRGLIAVEATADVEGMEPAALIVSDAAGEVEVWAHPSLALGGRLPAAARPPEPAESVSQARESDGLEPILRLAALWQRAGAGPLRRTQQGALYKRDSERIEEGGLLAAPVDDVPSDLPDLSSLWIGLARRVGLLTVDRSDDSLRAAPAEFWTENAVHLPQMLASAWLGLRSWDERGTPSADAPSHPGPPAASLRPSVLLRLAALEPDAWTTLDALGRALDADAPGWDRLGVEEDAAAARRARSPGKRNPASTREAQATRLLERIVLGGAYALGLVRAGEEMGSKARAVQLTPLGRYVLATGPPPPPRPTFDQFLFVQPNLEIIAYRQGLTPPIIGRLSRFAWWSRIGAAVELKLTQESVALGLEWGMTAAEILDVMAKHSQRALPGSVKDAVDRWADRREQVTFYSAATLVEFLSREERDRALASWRSEGPSRRPFEAVADRFILAEDAQDVPTARISTTAARDYRLPPERCVTVEADGVTLGLETARSDLLAEAELARFADEEPAATGRPSGRRRFVVTARSLDRALDAGLTTSILADWFRKRTGQDLSPAVRLMLRPATTHEPGVESWHSRRLLVLTAPSAETLDGVVQHPDTRGLVGERLGPTTVVVPEENVDALRERLRPFGIAFGPS